MIIMIRLFSVICFIVFLLSGCVTSDSRKPVKERSDNTRASPVSVPVVPSEVTKLIIEHVRATRGWTVDSYELGYLATEGDEIAISVTPNSERYDKNPSYLGSRNAFFVWVNTQTLKVTREGKLQ